LERYNDNRNRPVTANVNDFFNLLFKSCRYIRKADYFFVVDSIHLAASPIGFVVFLQGLLPSLLLNFDVQLNHKIFRKVGIAIEEFAALIHSV